jgi:hypothetical protein
VEKSPGSLRRGFCTYIQSPTPSCEFRTGYAVVKVKAPQLRARSGFARHAPCRIALVQERGKRYIKESITQERASSERDSTLRWALFVHFCCYGFGLWGMGFALCTIPHRN